MNEIALTILNSKLGEAAAHYVNAQADLLWWNWVTNSLMIAGFLVVITAIFVGFVVMVVR